MDSALLLVILFVVGGPILLFFVNYLFNKKEVELLSPENSCFLCKRYLNPSTDEHVSYSTSIQGLPVLKYVCRSCMQSLLDKQDGVCPHCGEALQWNGELRQINNMWCHAKCTFKLQSGEATITKEISKQIIIKVRCPYCNSAYDESLDNCPQCGAKHG